MGYREQVGMVQDTALRTFGRGEVVTWHPVAGGGDSSIRGIYRDAHIEADPDTGVPISSNDPVLHVQLAELPAGGPQPGDEVTVRATRWRVVDHQDDGEGMTMLVLQRVPA